MNVVSKQDIDELFNAAMSTHNKRLDEYEWMLEESLDEVSRGDIRGLIDVNDALNSYFALCFSGRIIPRRHQSNWRIITGYLWHCFSCSSSEL